MMVIVELNSFVKWMYTITLKAFHLDCLHGLQSCCYSTIKNVLVCNIYNLLGNRNAWFGYYHDIPSNEKQYLGKISLKVLR